MDSLSQHHDVQMQSGQPCHSTKAVSSSTTSLQSCRCGPECGTNTCGKPRTPSWETWQLKLFLGCVGAFILWAIIYFSITISMQNNDDADDNMDMGGMHGMHAGHSG